MAERRSGRLTRRQGLGLGLAASLATRLADAARPAGAAVEVAPGLFVLPGVAEDASAANLGAIANTGFILGRDAVAVVDPGGSLAHGQRLRAAVAAATRQPIRYLILTHAHPDHVMGAAAFADCGAAVIGHARLPLALAQRGPYDLPMLARSLGAAAAGSGALAPTQLVTERLALDLGGRELVLQAHPPAHTDQDLTVLDAATRTLWTGDLLFVERIPALEGSLAGWLAVLERLRALPAGQAVPGHGPPSVPWPEAAEPLGRYLLALRDGTRAALRAGIGIAEAPDRVAVVEARHWRLAEAYHGRNVTAAYRELEWE
ncbi:quinoprotein relay system zinc metallohydrolase 2 [Roseicella frigidaeris]|uniref:Quinoprotein relay system zinc metallohydrolase 2 n=1 Tax=Roseicella frigidaeris TaxID=2230885 RepID=A0A327M7S3_9PROT|nr:quinoprotein relay system zinc metallohydrolase 2 [Roseicella frigidaeris]RAI56118.1 quinoprotein relay system zinc metallohydrolase 2 [Roseicella frigidaeris]